MIKRIKNYFSILLMFLILAPASGVSSEKKYTTLEAQKITFQYYIGFIPFNGFFLLKDSTFKINFKKPSDSILNLKFDLNSSSAGFPLATYAMLGEAVLYAQKYPYIFFESTKIEKNRDIFEINGIVTIRGISKTIKLLANLKNPEILSAKEKESLKFDISAKLRRSDFKATGYKNIVGEIIDLNSQIVLVTSK